MPCDTQFQPGQGLAERKIQVREAVAALARALATGRAKAIVGPQGAIAFTGWERRSGITDACAYRRIMASGGALARLAIQRAELRAGRGVDRATVAAGTHSHDGGATWGAKG